MSAQPHNKSYFKLVCEMALQYFIYIEFFYVKGVYYFCY